MLDEGYYFSNPYDDCINCPELNGQQSGDDASDLNKHAFTKKEGE